MQASIIMANEKLSEIIYPSKSEAIRHTIAKVVFDAISLVCKVDEDTTDVDYTNSAISNEDAIGNTKHNTCPNNISSLMSFTADNSTNPSSTFDTVSISRCHLQTIIQSSISVWDPSFQKASKLASCKNHATNITDTNGKAWYDIEIRTATSMFHRYKTIQKNQIHQDNVETEELRAKDESSDNFICSKNYEHSPSSHTKLETEILQQQTKTNTTTTKKKTKKPQNEQKFVLRLTSPMGVQRDIQTPYDFASLLVPYIEEMLVDGRRVEVQPTQTTSNDFGKLTKQEINSIDLSHKEKEISKTGVDELLSSKHVRIAVPSGFICICTDEFLQYKMKQQRHEKEEMMPGTMMVPCLYCPKWCKGQQGLWWHIQQQHTIDHSKAYQAALTVSQSLSISGSESSTAIVLYTNNNKDQEISSSEVDNSSVKRNKDFVSTNKSTIFTETNKINNTSKNYKDHLLFTIVKNDNFIELREYWNNLSSNFSDSYLERNKDDLTLMTNPSSYFDTILDANGSTLLMWACGCGYTSIVKYLIEQCHCNPNCTQQQHVDHHTKNDKKRRKSSFHGRTALHWAARNGHVETVRYLLSLKKPQQHYYVDSNNCQNNQQQRLVHVDATTSDGTTAFCWAAWHGHIEIMYLLYDAGCNIQSVNVFGCNAALWTAQGSNQSVSSSASLGQKNEAYITNQKNTMAFSVHDTTTEKGVSIDMINRNKGLKDEPLLLSSNKNHRHVEKTRITAASLSVEQQPIPSTNTAQNNAIETLSWLHSIGCPIDLINHSGHGVLHKAAQRGHWELCQWYLFKYIVPEIEQLQRVAVKYNNLNAPAVEQKHGFGKYFNVVGPDNDHCTPSDLAGMEHHTELAVYLTQLEDTLIKSIFDSFFSRTDATYDGTHDTHVNHTNNSHNQKKRKHSLYYFHDDDVPTWIRTSILPANNQQDHMVFEPWGGVNRMRLQWNKLVREREC